MTSGMTSPTHSFGGKSLQRLDDFDQTADTISVSAFADSKRGWIVFSWFIKCDVTCSKLMKSLEGFESYQQVSLMLQFMVKNFENISISPDWWESLREPTREALIDLVNDSVSAYESLSGEGLRSAFITEGLPQIINVKRWGPQT